MPAGWIQRSQLYGDIDRLWQAVGQSGCNSLAEPAPCNTWYIGLVYSNRRVSLLELHSEYIALAV